MGFFKRLIRKGGSFLQRGIRSIGGGIKRLAKKIGGAFGKLGILGHIGMMFLMPYLPGWWGTLGEWATRLTQGTSMAGQAFGHVMRGIYHAGKAVGTVYRGVTEAISGSLKWLGNKAGAMFGKPELFGANPFAGLESWKTSVSDWGKEGWTGSLSADPNFDPNIGPSEHEFSTGETTLTDQMKEQARAQGVDVYDDPLTSGDFTQGAGDYRIQKIGGIDPASVPNRFQSIKDFTNIDDLKSFITTSQEQGITFSAGEKTFLQDAYTQLSQQKKSLMERAKDFGSDFGEKVKKNLSAEGLADAATEGATGGLKQAVGQKVMEAAGYEQPDYISKKVVVPTIQTFQGNILDNNQMNTFASNGYNYGSHQMNQFYGEVFKKQDPYLIWLNNLYPPENTNQYKAA
jgi:hypothetical protein